MKMEAEAGAIRPQGQERLEPPESGRVRSFSESLQRERGPAHTSVSDFWTPEPGEDTFLRLLISWYVVTCYGSPRTLTQGSCTIIFTLGAGPGACR